MTKSCKYFQMTYIAYVSRSQYSFRSRATMPAYFVYCRKSSDAEDRQILSIDSQISELKRHAVKKGFNIAIVLTEAKSAKAPGLRSPHLQIRCRHKEFTHDSGKHE